MIDDGRYDPPEIKIENHPWSLSHFERWERELKTPKPSRFWTFMEVLGAVFGNGWPL